MFLARARVLNAAISVSSARGFVGTRVRGSCLEADPDTRWDCAWEAGPEMRFDSDCEGKEVLGRVVADDTCAEVLSSSVRS